MPPDPPRLAAPSDLALIYTACACDALLEVYIGHLWKLLLRTLIRHRDHKEMRLHCTLTNHC